MTVSPRSSWPGLTFFLCLVVFAPALAEDQDSLKLRLRQADRAMSARDFQKAAAAYQSALEEMKAGTPRGERDLIHLKLARAQRSAGDTAAALQSLAGLRSGGPDPRLRAEAFRDSIEMAKEARDRPALVKILEEMQAAPEPLSGRAALEKGKLEYEDSRFSEAYAIFEGLAAAGGPGAPEARLWRIRSLRALKRTGDLETACREALEDPKAADPAVLQAAGSILAEMMLEGAKDGRGVVREALLTAARAASAGPPSREDSAADYVRALLVEARAYLALSSGASSPATQETYRERAAALYREVASGFRKIEGAKEAEEALAKENGGKSKADGRSQKPGAPGK